MGAVHELHVLEGQQELITMAEPGTKFHHYSLSHDLQKNAEGWGFI